MVQMLFIFALFQLTFVYGQTNLPTTTLSNNYMNKQIDQGSEQSVLNSNNALSVDEITNIIIIILLFMIIILCIVLIYYVKTHAKRTHKQMLKTMMQMQQYQIQNLSPTVNTANTVPSELTVSRKHENPVKHDKDFSITINRIHRAFTTPVPSPIKIDAKPVYNNTEIHGPFNIKRRSERVNTCSNASDLSPAIIASSKITSSVASPMLERIASDPQIYEMEGKNIELETSLANNIKHGTDSDESMYDNQSDINSQIIKTEAITPRGNNKPFVIDVTEVSVSDNDNDNDMPPPMEYNNFEEKSFEPLDMPNLPNDRLSQLSLTTQLAHSSNQYRTLEKYQFKKQRETLGDIKINWTESMNLDIIHTDNVVDDDSVSIHDIELTDNGNGNKVAGNSLIRCEDRFD